MKNPNYVVNRDEIYVGILSGTKKEKIIHYPTGMYDFSLSTKEDIYTYFDNQNYLFQRKDHLVYGNGNMWEHDFFERTMLFVLDQNKCANDLLYNSPPYPIFNISDDKLCIDAPISIKNYVYEMGKVLKYFNYKEKLTYEDIIQIQKYFFGDFILENCELFGRYDTGSDGSGYETYDLNGRHRTFNEYKKDSIFPVCYFELFFNTRNHYIPSDNSIRNRFLPDPIEGKIKKISKK